ncbi:chemotaxis protein CheD (plasmid) [Natrialbaceae archaeon A-arb3/5]
MNRTNDERTPLERHRTDRAQSDGDESNVTVSTDHDSTAGDPILVGIADYALTTADDSLKTSGLGSCIGVAVHDEFAGVSGLLHFMLPGAAEVAGDGRPAAKFADTGLTAMLSEFEALGGNAARSWAKVAGGATMVEFEQGAESIGERNVAAVRRELDAYGVSIAGTDFGGNRGRSIEFDPESGTLTITCADGVERRL